MAVKASATITLTQYRDTQSVTRYYKLQPAGSSAPLKPETKPPSSDWTDSEPACDISKELYFCDLTIFSNGEGEYSKVSKSTSYEAAKQAYNKANDASTAAGNAQTGVDSLNDTVFGVQTFEYNLDGVTIPAHKREDGTYYYILNDEEVTVAESALVHDADGELTNYQDGGIYDDLETISGNVETIGTKVDGFDAREDAIYTSIEQNSLIARNYARFAKQSLIITNESETKRVEDLKSYLRLESDSINIYSNKTTAVAIGVINNSGYMEMRGTSLFIAQESRLSTIRLRSAEKIGKLALVAGSDGHVSLREVLD